MLNKHQLKIKLRKLLSATFVRLEFEDLVVDFCAAHPPMHFGNQQIAGNDSQEETVDRFLGYVHNHGDLTLLVRLAVLAASLRPHHTGYKHLIQELRGDPTLSIILNTSIKDVWEGDAKNRILETLAIFSVAPAVDFQNSGISDRQGRTSTFEGFQNRIGDRLGALNASDFYRQFYMNSRRICQIIVTTGNGDEPRGTGFLVGPDLVLTCFHCLRKEILSRTDFANAGMTEVKCRFDMFGRSSVQLPQDIRLMENFVDWHIDSSPPVDSDSEAAGFQEARSPNKSYLDFALIRLKERLGEQPILADEMNAGLRRGWIPIPRAAPILHPGMAIVIFQNPEQVIQIGIDTSGLESISPLRTRFRHFVTTAPGSSGAPCFALSDWSLIGLHQFSDPNPQSPRFNQGIPIEAVASKIERFLP